MRAVTIPANHKIVIGYPIPDNRQAALVVDASVPVLASVLTAQGDTLVAAQGRRIRIALEYPIEAGIGEQTLSIRSPNDSDAVVQYEIRRLHRRIPF